ncbi:MAG: hypothetical protein WAT20_08590 [Ferruginibacter sp.]|nr:hypothetical protein [Chitinophagaceae bacterium]
MNTYSKIMLSDDELQLVTNTEWILTKRKIIDKINGLLGDVAASQQQVIENEKSWLPATVVSSAPKIAKGENYRQLPYLMLDYPRCFDAENIFAVRTMFWWGNFFSITLQVSGLYKEKFQQKIIDNIGAMSPDVFICIHENQWQHHFEEDNYMSVKQFSRADLTDTINKKQFIKLGIKFPLQPWAALPSLLDKSFLEIIKLLKD